jgi:hypothetical protein
VKLLEIILVDEKSLMYLCSSWQTFSPTSFPETVSPARTSRPSAINIPVANQPANRNTLPAGNSSTVFINFFPAATKTCPMNLEQFLSK